MVYSLAVLGVILVLGSTTCSIGYREFRKNTTTTQNSVYTRNYCRDTIHVFENIIPKELIAALLYSNPNLSIYLQVLFQRMTGGP